MKMKNKISTEVFKELKTSTTSDDRHLFFENVLNNPEDWATWEDIIECGNEPDVYSINFLSKKGIDVMQDSIRVYGNYKESKTTSDGEEIKHTNCPNLKELLAKNFSIVITNWERKNKNAAKLIKYLCEHFYLNVNDHGIWPARVTPYSGHAHLYCGLQESSSFNPHCDGPNNFIFQIQGETEVTIFENRQSSLVNLNTFLVDEESKGDYDKIYSCLRVAEKKIMKPGDMVYIPSRQFHHIKPLSDRISISFPLILKGPSSVML